MTGGHSDSADCPLMYLSIMNDKISFRIPDTIMTKEETVTRTIITTHKYKPECDLCHDNVVVFFLIVIDFIILVL